MVPDSNVPDTGRSGKNSNWILDNNWTPDINDDTWTTPTYFLP